MGDNLFVGGYDVSGDINAISGARGGPAALPFTAIIAYAMERKGGIRNGGISFISYLDTGASQSHAVFKPLPRTDIIVGYWMGTALGNPAAELVGKQIGYNLQRPDDGSVKFTVDAESNNYGLEWCEQLTAGKRTDTAATNGTGVDLAAATTFGLQAYLHVFSFAGTDVTIKLQESSDNAVGDPYANVTGGAFTAVTVAPTHERIQTARGLSVERYLRVVTTTVSGFTSCVFAVAVAKNPTSVVF